MAWLLSAALARRQGDAARAARALAEAERRAPGDPAIAAERARIDGVQAAPEAANIQKP
jgi:cytochrome c-type biogenesis protein CcmH/NrfG